MTMNFNAKDAAKTTYNALKAESECMRRCAETTITHLIEPRIQQAANAGENKLSLFFHKTQAKLYKEIYNILIENGYKVIHPYEQNSLIVKWESSYFGA